MARNIRTISTPVLEVAYEVSGPIDGHPVFLVHGWPDDASTWDAIRPLLNEAGFRTVVPYLRGFGKTIFRNSETMRSGQIAALASDLIETADALGIDQFSVIGHDWGGRTAYAVAALFPKRLRACAVLSVGYRTPPGDQSFALAQAQNYWYQWFMRTPIGKAQLEQDRKTFCSYLWNTWMFPGKFVNADYDAANLSFNNDEWLDVTLHSYLHRWGDAPGDARYAALEERLQSGPLIHVPTVVLHGLQDPCNAPVTSAGREAWFTAGYTRHELDHCGHFPQREQPVITAKILLRFFESLR